MSDIILWRYLTFEQLEDILDTSTLFFTHRDQIPEYEEGKIPDNSAEQYREWAEQCYTGVKIMHSLMGVETVASTYNLESIVQGEMKKTEDFINNTYFVCFRKDKFFSQTVKNALNKHLAIKISYSKLSTYWKNIGLYTISSDIYYTQNRNSINALKRLNLLLNVPNIWEDEQEFRILLPLNDDYKTYLYKVHLEDLEEKGILPEDDDDKDLYMSKKEYDLFRRLQSEIIEDENNHGVKVPFDTSIIEEIYIPIDKYDEYSKKYPEFTNKLRIIDANS